MANERILVIEDEPGIRELLKITLGGAGYHVEEAANGESGLRRARGNHPDLILLDLMLPGVDGLSVCRTLKAAEDTRAIPVIMLTAKSEESDIVLGLEMGASDYITKPFSGKVLVARVRAQLRDLTNDAPPAETRYGGLIINRDQYRVQLDGRDIALTHNEFSLLLIFATHPGRVYTRNQIIAKIKGDDYPVTARAVDVQIVNLRRKLGRWGAANIETIRGVGYRLKMEEPA